MDVPAETLDALSGWFLQSLSPDASVRRAAESSLAAAASAPGFPLALLRLASLPSADPQARLAAAVHFKNLLRSRWSPDADNPLPGPDRELIKSLLLPLLLDSPTASAPPLRLPRPRLRRRLPRPLALPPPNLVSALSAASADADFPRANAVLSAAHSLFLKFRHSFDTPALRLDLKYCLDLFAAPLLDAFLRTSRLISSSLPSSPAALRPLFESQRLCCEIFHSLNAIELPEFFEDHMREWMTEFRAYLTAAYPPAVEADGTVDALRAAICENLQLYMEKNEEEFKDYLKDFASAVWGLLMTSSASPSRDHLTVTAIKFLTTVSTSVHHSLFGSPDVLQQICTSIVFPNIRLRDEDEELFEMNYVEYIRRDIEGSDVDTLRRIACELLKGIASNYREQVTALVSAQIQAMLASFAANPTENWKEKDAAIYLAVTLTPKQTGSGGAPAYLVDVESFFTSVIVPELQGPDPNATPMLKAGALKFFTVFRDKIPKSAALALLPSVIRFLASESNVVHSYAANCIEKLLLVKDRAPAVVPGSNAVPTAPRYTASDINPVVPQVITGLFNALQFPESQENPYIMKCMMRVLGVANLGGEVAASCVSSLASVLVEVCKNPKNPTFNHYLFEAIAAVVGRSGEQDPSLLPMFEMSLFPVLQKILVEDIAEFWPYAFQIFAQLIELSKPPISGNYMQLFQVLLSPDSWKRSASAPALVRLLQAYLQKVPNELNNEGRLLQVLDIFSRLVSVPSTEELGFFVLNTVVENLNYDMITPHIKNIWAALFTRLQNRRTVKFVNSLVIFMSLVLVKHRPDVLVDSVNAVQPNIFPVILLQFWIPNLKLISGSVEVKLTAVASTRLICESPSLLEASAAELWGKMLDGIITLLTKSDKFGAEVEDDVLDIHETVGYSVSFARLHYAGKREDDPLKEIRDPKHFLVTSLARLSAQSPGRFPAVIEKYVDPANQNTLLQLCATYNSTIV
ncbi:Exportin-2 [Ananas comosus]|uniref:Exportin-2 n=1 Tax=Ananas comosus TaxID=4615 RepID=A0A199W434_ANACO|nr:Exportin-2 [Ananas comosus]